MKTSELISVEEELNEFDACMMRTFKRRQPPYNRPVITQSVMPSDEDHVKVVVMEDEQTGLAQYHLLYPDGHMGAALDS